MGLYSKRTRACEIWAFRGPATIAVVLGWCVGWSSSVSAQPGAATFVTRSLRGSDVLQVSTDLELPASMVMGNASVTIRCARGPSKADRNLEVVFYCQNWQGGSPETLAYRKSVRLPEGSTQVRVEFPHVQSGVQNGAGGTWDVAVFENGRDIEDERQRAKNVMAYQYVQNSTGTRTQSLGAIVASDQDEAVERRGLMRALERAGLQQYGYGVGYGVGGYAGAGYGGAVLRAPGTVAGWQIGWQVHKVDEAADDWRRYLPYSMWFLSIEAAREIVADRPELARTLVHYVSAGGSLMIHSVASAEDRVVVQQLLGRDNRMWRPDLWESLKAPKAPWWEQEVASVTGGGAVPQAPTVVTKTVNGTNVRITQQIVPNPPVKASPPVADAVSEPSPIAARGAVFDAAIAAETWYQLSHTGHMNILNGLGDMFDGGGLGSSGVGFDRYEFLKAFAAEEVVQSEFLAGRVLLASKPLDQLSRELLNLAVIDQVSNSMEVRVGYSGDGNWFWRNLIAAVGKPPVWIFCAAVALFGLILGPGLLALTGWIGRRSLMILLVPSVALVATVAIILYGVFHEGFATHIRVTSVQRVDPTTGQGFAWSRQNYFSGMPPRSGLTFARDTFARPVYADDQTGYGYRDPRDAVSCNVLLTDSQQWLGWLRPRQHQQLLIGHPLAQVQFPIAVERSASGGVRVLNRSPNDIVIAVLRGGGDDYYVLESLNAGQTLEAEALDQPTAESRVARAVVDVRPAPPPELRGGGSLMLFGRLRTSGTVESPDVINVDFDKYMSDRLAIPPFGMAVLQTESQVVEIPLAGESADDLHLVIGAQPW